MRLLFLLWLLWLVVIVVSPLVSCDFSGVVALPGN